MFDIVLRYNAGRNPARQSIESHPVLIEMVIEGTSWQTILLRVAHF
jgi:hypothetical protein